MEQTVTVQDEENIIRASCKIHATFVHRVTCESSKRRDVIIVENCDADSSDRIEVPVDIPTASVISKRNVTSRNTEVAFPVTIVIILVLGANQVQATSHSIISLTEKIGMDELTESRLSRVDYEFVKGVLTVTLWIFLANIGKIAFNWNPYLHNVFPESCLLIIIGAIVSRIGLYGTNLAISAFTPTIFYFYMLPPIVLDTGYFMPSRLFFDNLASILLLVIIGTLFNIMAVGFSLWAMGLAEVFDRDHKPGPLDALLFASVLSSVEANAVLALFEKMNVKEILYIMILGESIFNDAIVLVIYNMVEAYKEIGTKNLIAQDLINGFISFIVVMIGGTFVGIFYGLLAGLGTKYTEDIRVIEPGFIFVMAYMSFLTGEIFRVSGVLSIIVCCLTMKNYTESNISEQSATTVKYVLKMLSSSSQAVLYIFLGIATVQEKQDWDTMFVLLTIAFCTIYRFIGVIVLMRIANLFRLHKFTKIDQFFCAYSGLRGAVTFALTLVINEKLFTLKTMFTTTTIAVIYFTVFFQGITLKPLIKFFSVNRATKHAESDVEKINERFMELLISGINEIVGQSGGEKFRDKFKRFDDKFIRPWLINDIKTDTYNKVITRNYAKKIVEAEPIMIAKQTERRKMVISQYQENEDEDDEEL